MNARSSTLIARESCLHLLTAITAAVNSAVAQTSRQISPTALASILADLATPRLDHPTPMYLSRYFDYNCPVCRRVEPELRKLLAGDREFGHSQGLPVSAKLRLCRILFLRAARREVCEGPTR